MATAGNLFYSICSTRAGHAVTRSAIRTIRRAGALKSSITPLDALELPHEAMRGLTSLWRAVHWSSGDGMMPPDQLLAVYRLACSWPADGDIVELGSWTGLTTCYLSTACRVRGSGKVHAVDTFAGTREEDTQYASIDKFGGSTLAAFRSRITSAGLSDLVIERRGLTSERAADYTGKPIRVLLIDADHSYGGVRSDFELWLPHVAEGGLVLFHDHDMPPVARFVGEAVSDPRVDAKPGLIVPNLYGVRRSGP